jgi:hypothetical protein
LRSAPITQDFDEVRYDVATAEELLREIATDLIRMPVDDRARHMHLKALALKRVVMGWSRQPPPEENLLAMMDALHALRIEVLDLRSTSEVRLRSTRVARPTPVEVDLGRRRAKAR